MWVRVAAMGVVGPGRLFLPGLFFPATQLLLASLLGGCGEPELACRPGFSRAEDGHCYPPPPDPGPPTFNDVLENLDPCVPLKPGEQLDLAGGCIQGVCAGDTFGEADRAYGEGVSCQRSGQDWDCNWPLGVAALFAPTDNDQGGPASGARARYVRARYLYEGATADGLGIGASISCFVEALGLPESVVLVKSMGQVVPNQLVWDSMGLEIEDEERQLDLLAFPDGKVDEITLTGPP